MRRMRMPGPINSPRLWLPDFGDGSDGSPASSSFTVGKQVYQWTDYTLDDGDTITLSQTYKPSILRCQGTLDLSGAINAVGKGYDGGARVVSGGGPGSTIGADGSGLEPGLGVFQSPGSAPKNSLGKLGDLLLQLFGAYWAGSGSASGGCNQTDGDAYGGDGAKGGNGLILIARRIVIGATAVINASGANGNNGSRPNSTGTAYGSCGGAAGDVLLLADYIELPDSGTVISALGGSPGQDSPAATTAQAGENGHIYLCPLRSISGDPAARCNPDAVVVDLARLPIALG